jgi:intracellular septation protein
MSALIDFLPGVVFLAALLLSDIYTATAVTMGATVLQIALLLVLRKKITAVHWFTLGVVLVFGTATLVLHDATFIKWKPTVINWIMAGALLLGPPLLGKNFIRLLLQEHVKAPDAAWSRVNYAWAAMFLALGALNLVVAFNFTERTWGFFKVFGMPALIAVFSLAQMLYLGRFAQPDTAETAEAPKS